MKLPLLALFALTATQAFAANDWQPVYSVGERQVLVDALSIDSKGELARFWWKQAAQAPTLDLGLDGKPYQFLSTLSEVDCTLKTQRHRHEVRFNPTGPFVYTPLDVLKPLEPIPEDDALAQALAGFVCTHLPPPSAAPEPEGAVPAPLEPESTAPAAESDASSPAPATAPESESATPATAPQPEEAAPAPAAP